jgi:hypothetical protein
MQDGFPPSLITVVVFSSLLLNFLKLFCGKEEGFFVRYSWTCFPLFSRWVSYTQTSSRLVGLNKIKVCLI